MANEFIKPPKEIKELPNNCKLLVQQIIQGVSMELAFRVCFGAAADNLTDETCKRRAKAIYEHPTMQTYAQSLVKKAEKISIKKVADNKVDFLAELQELKGLALTKADSKGRISPDLKVAMQAQKLMGETQGFFNHATEVNINIRDMLNDTSNMKAVNAAVVHEVDELSGLAEIEHIVNGEKQNDR